MHAEGVHITDEHATSAWSAEAYSIVRLFICVWVCQSIHTKDSHVLMGMCVKVTCGCIVFAAHAQ